MKNLLILLFISFSTLLIGQIEIADLCTEITEKQTFNVRPDGAIHCIEGTFDGANMESAPLPGDDCFYTEFPTVWFKVHLEETATNIKTSVVFDNQWYPIWAIYYGDDCNNLHQIKSNGFGCSWNANNFEWEVLTRFDKDGNMIEDYYVAITAEGGFPNPGDNSFEFCVEAYEDTSSCFYNQNFNNPNFGHVSITERSCGNSLDGPFYQGEEVTVRFEYNFNAATLGSESWFQSLIPDFGPGWEMYTRDNLINVFPDYGTWSDGSMDCHPIANEFIADMCIYTNDLGQEVICNQLYENCPCSYGIDEAQLLPSGWFWNTPGGAGCSSSCMTGTSYGILDGKNTFVVLEFKMRVRQFDAQSDCEANSDLYINIQPFNDDVTGCWEDPVSTCYNIKKIFSPEWKIDCSTTPTDCQEFKLLTEVYYDINENGVRDTLEPLYNQGAIRIEPLGSVHYLSQSNVVYLDEGVYEIYYDTLSTPDWMLTNDSNYYSVELDTFNDCDTIYFGLKPLSENQELSTSFTLTSDRCLTDSKLIATVDNNGQTFSSGWLWVKLDLNVNDFDFEEMPDTMVSSHLFGWKFDNLPPGNQYGQTVNLVIPGPPTFIPGVFIQFETAVSLEANLDQAIDVFTKNVLVRCSYDPNDKQVHPLAENGYTNLDNKTLTYTIRFQNTGNAEAYDIQIRDTLSEYLDPLTFKLIKTSHPLTLESKRESDRVLVFSFNNIYLPDSTTDLVGSQGFVTYSIELKEGLPEGTEVENTAFIYFDQNPPIQTNTTSNTFYLDVDNDGFLSIEDCNDENANINPDAVEIANNGIDENCDGELLIIDVDGDGFNSDEDCDDDNANINPDAIEIANNEVDENCDGELLIIDDDGDGFNSDEDCDDENAMINPDAVEIANNDIDENCDGELLIIDEDMDGYNSDEDCNDNDPDINPGAQEIPNNLIDENCDEEVTIIDDDNDGFNSDEDCDDQNAEINPDAIEIPNNGIDEDCDGEDLVTSTNDLIASQISIHPNPVYQLFTIDTQLEIHNLEIINHHGQVVKSMTQYEVSKTVDLADLSSGVYLVKIELSEKYVFKRIVKM